MLQFVLTINYQSVSETLFEALFGYQSYTTFLKREKHIQTCELAWPSAASTNNSTFG